MGRDQGLRSERVNYGTLDIVESKPLGIVELSSLVSVITQETENLFIEGKYKGQAYTLLSAKSLDPQRQNNDT